MVLHMIFISSYTNAFIAAKDSFMGYKTVLRYHLHKVLKTYNQTVEKQITHMKHFLIFHIART